MVGFHFYLKTIKNLNLLIFSSELSPPIAHLDIKSPNILLTKPFNGKIGDYSIKISDFGTARVSHFQKKKEFSYFFSACLFNISWKICSKSLMDCS